jgi:hypothetical protein
MADASITLCVGSPALRSSVWKIWTARSEVFVVPKEAQSGLKLSLHSSGIFRLAFASPEELARAIYGSHETVAVEGIVPAPSRLPEPDRVLHRWNARQIIPGFVVAFRVLIPVTELRPLYNASVDLASVRWLPTADQDRAIELSVCLAGWDRQNVQVELRGKCLFEHALESGVHVLVSGRAAQLDASELDWVRRCRATPSLGAFPDEPEARSEGRMRDLRKVEDPVTGGWAFWELAYD